MHWEVFGACVFLGVEFVPEGRRALAPMTTSESEELTRHKEARMRGHNVEKARLGFGVTQRLQGFNVRLLEVQKAQSRRNGRRGGRSLYRRRNSIAGKVVGSSLN